MITRFAGKRRNASRAIIALIAVGALSAAGCDQVKTVGHKAEDALRNAGVLPKQKTAENENPNPAPAPAPEEPTQDGPVVLTPGETPTPNSDGAPAEPGDTTPPPTPDAPGETPTTPPATPEPTQPTTPTSPEPTTPEPTTPEPTTPAPATPTTPTAPPPSTSADSSLPNYLFAEAGKFIYRGVGLLQAGSGNGAKDETIYAPGITFPIKNAPTFLNSQVYGTGGMSGAAGSECSAVNYAYPWQDNFCEKRSGVSRASYNCPSKAIHQGQDIRAGDAGFCTKIKKVAAAERKGIEIVAVEDGVIQYIGAYTVDLRQGPRIYRYLHMNMKALKVKLGDTVKKGQQLGYLSNDFGVDSAGKPVATTLHLHFEIKQNIDGVGWTWVSPYMSLLAAYKETHPDASIAQ